MLSADNGCLQYYTGVSGTLQSFNYDGTNGRHLSNQDYSICIRTEFGFCSIIYSVCPGGVYSLSGPAGTTAATAAVVGTLVIRSFLPARLYSYSIIFATGECRGLRH